MILRLFMLPALGGSLLLATAAAEGSSKPKRQLIAFWSDRAGLPGVWVMRVDGSGRRLLTGTRLRAKRGDFSPNSRRLVFDGQAAGGGAFDFDIQVIGVDGHHRHRLTHGSVRDTEPHWSPAGNTIVFERKHGEFGRSELWTIRPGGGKPRRIGPGLSPVWSPSGRRLLFSLPNKRFGADVYVMRADGTRLRALLRTPDDDYPAAWSRDGWVLLTRVSRTRPHADVFVLRSNGRGLRRLTRCMSFCYAADFSPRGGRILFTRVVNLQNTERGQVFAMRRDGSDQRNLSRNRADENAASWGG